MINLTAGTLRIIQKRCCCFSIPVGIALSQFSLMSTGCRPAMCLTINKLILYEVQIDLWSSMFRRKTCI
jgi:hypothetical protein